MDTKQLWGYPRKNVLWILLAIVVAIAFVVFIFWKNGEGFVMRHPGYYRGYWGYRVPQWRRRWWERRRNWGYPLAGRRWGRYRQPYGNYMY